MKSTYELLVPIIAAIDKTFIITAVVSNTDGTQTLSACSTLWATQGFPVTIGGNDYKITGIVPNVSITVSGTPTITAPSFQLYPPVFYHGTVRATQEDLNSQTEEGTLNTWDKLPMIWLHEPTDETINEDPMKSIVMVSKCELYFMIDSDFTNWTNGDHYTYAIKPMRNLIDSFMLAVRKSKTVNDNKITTSSPKDFAKWGVRLGKDGGDKNVFSIPQSGSKLEVDIPFIRSNATCC